MSLARGEVIAGGRLNVGKHIAVADNTPSANAILDVMQAAGVTREQHGNSTGTIAGLKA